MQRETKLVAGPSDVHHAHASGSPMSTATSSQTQVLDERRLKNGPLMTDGRMETESGRLDDRSNNLKQEAKSAIDLPAEEGLKAQAVTAVNGVLKKDKVRKRPREDGGSIGHDDTGDIKKKKKKKNKVLDIEAMSSKDGGESRGKLAGKSAGIGLGHGEASRTESQRRDEGVARTSELKSASARQPIVDLSSLNLEFPHLLSDLRELALDPFYETERDAPNIVLQVFRKFRIQVYLKSVIPSASEPDMAELRAPRVAAGPSLQKPGAGNADVASVKEAKDHRGPSSSAFKPSKPGMKPEDPAKAGRKRGPSDRQEELYAKKVKKMNQLRALSTEKKAGIHEKMQELQQRNQKESSTITTTSAVSAKPNNKVAAEPVKKQEPPPPPLTFSPTALVLKFPPRTTLPSVATLKAKFARFGSLIEGATRVYWKSYSCKVVFKHKPDAQAAINYARKYDLLFGQFKVQYHIRELDPSTLEPLSDIGRPRPTESRPNDGLVRPGNGGNGNGGCSLPQPRAQQRGAPAGQLKSILKKPGDEGGASAGNAAREAPPRVTFLLDGDNRAALPVVAAGSDGNSGSYAAGLSSSSYSSGPSSSSLTAGPSSSIPPLDPVSGRNPRSAAGFLPMPPPLLHSPLSNPPRTLDMQHLPPPPPLSQSVSLPPAPRVGDGLLPPLPPLPRMADKIEAHGPGPAWLTQVQLQHNGQQEAEGEFRNQMLTLLIRCRDIVTNVNSSLGYVPYHPL